MNIIVCVKQVPDTTELSKITPEAASSGNITAKMILNPWDEYAVEEALRVKEKNAGSKVTALSMGATSAVDALRQAVAMGVDEAILLSDPAFAGSDVWATAGVLAAAIRKLGAVDIVFCGKQAIDGDAGMLGAALARALNIPSLSLVAKIANLDAAGKKITIERMLEEGRETLAASLPAVVSVVKEINNPRYPNVINVRKASKAVIPTWAAKDLSGVEGKAGKAGSTTTWGNLRKPPARAAKLEIIEGATPQEKAARLMDKLIAEKVI